MKHRLVLLFALSGFFGVKAFAQRKMVIVGSSTAYGVGASVYDSAYAGRLQAAFRKNLGDNADTVLTNLAIGGVTSYNAMPTDFVPPAGRPAADVTRNITRALSLSPDVILINFPSNDIANGFTKQELMNNLRLMYRTATSAGVKTYVATSQPRDFLPNTTMMQYQRDLVDSIKLTFGAAAIDFWSVLADNQNNIRTELRYGDGIHVNNAGHALLFRQVWDKEVFGAVPKATGRIEAENFSAMYGVQKEVCLDADGGEDEGWIDNGDWMDFTVNVTNAGVYALSLRVASPNNGAQALIKKSDGSVLATVALVNTGGYQNWQTVTSNITLATGQQTIRVQSAAAAGWNFNWFALAYSAPLPAPAPAPVPAPLPVVSGSTTRIEAENYLAMSGVQTEATMDSSGSADVGWIDNGDWMDFSYNAPTSGTYTVNLRIATPNTGAQVQLKNTAGSILATATLPNTGGYQNWKTTSFTVTLAAGQQTIRLQSANVAMFNINWLEFTAPAAAPVITSAPPPPVATSTTRIEAENYASMSGIQTEVTLDAGGGSNVGWIDNGDWMDYSFNAPSAGTYTLNLRIATPNSGAQAFIKNASGAVLATANIPNTSGYQTWQTATYSVTLPAGQQTIRIQSSTAQIWNINWLELILNTTTPPPVVMPATTSTKIEAENYSTMYGVQLEATMDAGGGADVGWIDHGDWMDFAFNAPSSGTYTVNFRIATPNTGAQIQLKKSDGTVLTTTTLTNTGGYQNWSTVSTTVSLSAGQQTLRVQSAAVPMWNFNWMELIKSATVAVASTTTRIEAENYSTMSGIQLEATMDPLGGISDVGWIDNGDWMDYQFNAPAAGTYNFTLRIASPNNGVQAVLKNAGGAVLTTTNLPNTGGYQNWQTANFTVSLPAGQQTLRLQSSASAGWNINWLEFTGPAAGGSKACVNKQQSEVAVHADGLAVYPNPVKNRLFVSVNNEFSGQMMIQIFSIGGTMVKQVSVNKSSVGNYTSFLSVASLPAGKYVLKVAMKGWNQAKVLSVQ